VEIVIDGMKSGFYITQGYGDSSDEPPAMPPLNPKDAVLGLPEGGLIPESNQSPLLESE
jgi:hypothetical protein